MCFLAEVWVFSRIAARRTGEESRIVAGSIRSPSLRGTARRTGEECGIVAGRDGSSLCAAAEWRR